MTGSAASGSCFGRLSAIGAPLSGSAIAEAFKVFSRTSTGLIRLTTLLLMEST
jgi:hypothetical protein